MSAALTSAPDVPVFIIVPSDSGNNDDPPKIQSERRINPSWTVGQFKARMEPITGIPPGSMKIVVGGRDVSAMEEEERVESWGVSKGESVFIHDSRPLSLRQSSLFDPSAPDAAPKYTMPDSTYESRQDSVLAWKRANQLGRFDPSAPSTSDVAAQRHSRDSDAITSRNITVGQRCRVGSSDTRRGEIRFVGAVPEIGDKEKGALWVGVAFDEPVGKNRGEIGGKKYFEVQGENFGAFVRPENVEVGEQFGVLDDLLDEDMEEI